MKILFVCEGFSASSVVAQPWKHVFEIANRIMKKGNDVQIITNHIAGLPSEERIGKVPVQRIRKTMLSFDYSELLEILNAEDVDVINWHGSDIWSAIRFLPLRNSLQKSITWTLHSGVLSLKDLKTLNVMDYFQLFKFWNNITNALVPQIFIRRWTKVPILRHIITLSKRTATKLKDYRITHPISYIPSGVDIHTFKPLHTLAEEPILLYFGPMSPFRGIDVLLSAFRIVRERMPSAKLVLLAREVDKKNRFSRKIRKMKNTELIADILPQKSLLEHLRKASIVVLPFKFWPQVECPLTILEAMAVGKAVITTSVGAIPEIVADSNNGVLVPAKNAGALAEATIKLLIDSNKREKLGKNARAYVERFHDWNIIVDKTLDVFKFCT